MMTARAQITLISAKIWYLAKYWILLTQVSGAYIHKQTAPITHLFTVNPKLELNIAFKFWDIKTICIQTNPVWVNPNATSQNSFPDFPKDFSPKQEKVPGIFSETVMSKFIEIRIKALITIIEAVPKSHPAL